MKLKLATIVTAGAIILGGGTTLTAISMEQSSTMEIDRVVSSSKISSTTPKLSPKTADKYTTPVDVVSKGEMKKIDRIQFTAKPKPKPKPKPKISPVAPKLEVNSENKDTKTTTNTKSTNKNQGKKVVIATPAKKSDTSLVINSKMSGKSPKEYAKTVLASKGMGNNEFTCLVKLWNKESGWNYKAENPSSGAYGIPQSLPGSKMASKGSDWRTNYETQIDWGMSYISGRYGTPCNAWGHSQQKNWY